MKSTETKTRSLIKRDFDNAVRQPWSSGTCIVAQFMIRNRIDCGEISPYRFACIHIGLRQVQVKFDTAFAEPGDENKPKMQALRASLPIKVHLSKNVT